MAKLASSNKLRRVRFASPIVDDLSFIPSLRIVVSLSEHALCRELMMIQSNRFYGKSTQSEFMLLQKRMAENRINLSSS
ncbi:MAG: hypothetical protein ACYDHE_05395 [Candidatus Acidiferrales bacterium]